MRKSFFNIYFSLHGEFGKTLSAAREMQWRPADDIREYQWRKLSALIKHAYDNVPFYRERMKKAGFSTGNINDFEQFRKIPILTKKDINEHLDELVSATASKSSLLLNATGGSTGAPVHYYQDKAMILGQWAATHRFFDWAGRAPWDHVAKLWGSSFDIENAKPKTWKGNLYVRLFEGVKFFPAFEMNERTFSEFAEYVRRFKPACVESYAVPLALTGKYILDRGIDLSGSGVRCAVTSAEKLIEDHRKIIESAFHCRVYDRYGGRELGNVAAECGSGGYHTADDFLYLEILNEDGSPAKEGASGKIVITSLENFGMPFIRYQNDDMGTLATGGCECGRGLSRLKSIDGRIQGVITLGNGGFVSGVIFPHLFKDFDIKLYNIEQESLEYIKVRVVPGPDFGRKDEDFCKEVLSRHLPGMEIEFEKTDGIPAGPSGKFSFVTSKVKSPFS
ncbi:MAG TPA: hypothetical protein PLQ76_03390 [bacterium]|nr:hypothetical protein [bacterium]